MAKAIGTVDGEGFESKIWLETDEDSPSGRVWFVADADIDCDGGPNPDGDPCYQGDTALHFPKKPGGKPINPEIVPGIVVPTIIIKRTAGVVLGCRARVTNLRTMQQAEGVTFDTGPTNKNGELSPELARRIGIDPNANDGGEDYAAVLYELWPGIPAEVDGITYELQPA